MYSKTMMVAILVIVTLIAAMCAAVAVDVAPGVQVHGYIQDRIYHGPGAGAEYRLERLSLSTIAALPSDSNAYAEVYYHPWASGQGLYMESAYYDTPFSKGRLRVGKGRRLAYGIIPSYPNRKTSNYGLFAEAITQDRITGVQWVGSRCGLDLAADVQATYRLGIRQLGEIPGDTSRNPTHQVAHLAFRDPLSSSTAPTQAARTLAASARVGYQWCGIKAGLSGYIGTLDGGDLTAITATANSLLLPQNPISLATPTHGLVAPGTTSKNLQVWGPDVTYYSKWGLMASAEYANAEVSTLNYDAYYLLVGYEHLKSWKFYARYAKQDMKTPLTENPLSWDPSQLQLSIVQPLRKGLWLQYEYEYNWEHGVTVIGGPERSVRNNLGFVELFAGF